MTDAQFERLLTAIYFSSFSIFVAILTHGCISG